MAKGAKLYTPDDDQIFSLFDTGVIDHVCEIVETIFDEEESGYRTAMAESFERLLLRPLDDFVRRLYETGRGAHASEHDAAVAFRDYVQKLTFEFQKHEGQALARETTHQWSQILRSSWVTFIAFAGAHRMYADLPNELKTKRDNPKGPRKKVTAAQLEEFRDTFSFKNGGSDHGWIEQAVSRFSVSAKTIGRRLGKK